MSCCSALFAGAVGPIPLLENGARAAVAGMAIALPYNLRLGLASLRRTAHFRASLIEQEMWDD
jgi:hypothetical protein